MTPTVSMIVEVKDMPLADLRDLLRGQAITESPMRIQPSARPAQEVQPDEDLRRDLKAARDECRSLQIELSRERAKPPEEQPTWDGEAPKDRMSVQLLEHAPQDLLNLSVFLEKLDDGQLDTVWVAAILDALRETLPGPSIRGLTLCLNHVRDRYRRRLTGAEVSPIRVGGADSNIDNVRAVAGDGMAPSNGERHRGYLPRGVLLEQMLAAVPNIGDQTDSSKHWDSERRKRVKDIAMTDSRFNWIPAPASEPGQHSRMPGRLERIA